MFKPSMAWSRSNVAKDLAEPVVESALAHRVCVCVYACVCVCYFFFGGGGRARKCFDTPCLDTFRQACRKVLVRLALAGRKRTPASLEKSLPQEARQ